MALVPSETVEDWLFCNEKIGDVAVSRSLGSSWHMASAFSQAQEKAELPPVDFLLRSAPEVAQGMSLSSGSCMFLLH